MTNTLEKTVRRELENGTFYDNTMPNEIIDEALHLVFAGRVKERWMIVLGIIKTAMRMMCTTDITSDDLTIVANVLITSVVLPCSRMESLETIRDNAKDLLSEIQNNATLSKAFNVIRESVQQEIFMFYVLYI
tara:strand:+ start:53 stop:451 length:399 start_codon:yes stop_codon:yes gene_type:complete